MGRILYAFGYGWHGGLRDLGISVTRLRYVRCSYLTAFLN
jgi:hypothetical protein